MKVTFSKLFKLADHRVGLLFLFGLLSFNICTGQAVRGRKLMMFNQSSGLANDTVYLDIDQDIAVQLIPFDELLKIAVAYSPLIKYQSEISNSLNSTYQNSKVQILQNVGGFASYSSGDQSIISSGSVTDPNNNLNIGQIANGYRVGVDLRVSLYDLFGRKHQIKQAYSNYQASILQKETIVFQLKRELITIYQDMITAQQLLKIRLIDEQASLTAFRIAEAESQKGKITAEEVANATNRYVQTKSISEQVKGDFLKNVHQFEAFMGVPIQRLKRN